MPWSTGDTDLAERLAERLVDPTGSDVSSRGRLLSRSSFADKIGSSRVHLHAVLPDDG